MEEEKAKVRAVLRRIFPDVVVDDALVSTTHYVIEETLMCSSIWARLRLGAKLNFGLHVALRKQNDSTNVISLLTLSTFLFYSKECVQFIKKSFFSLDGGIFY